MVLDDAHWLRGSHSLASLAEALRTGLGSLRLVISSRIEPALPLARLRLSGALSEIGTDDLEFDEKEAASLLSLHDVQLTPDQLHVVLAKTEGWAAGLRLTAVQLESCDDPAALVAQLAGESRTVADYFVEEVLARQSPELTRFLLDTSVVRQVSAGLADALTGRSHGQRALTHLERLNLFTIALDSRRTWFRYHHLFGELLRQQLEVESPGRITLLHRRAASWFADNNDLLESARHWAAAGDWTELGRLVTRAAGGLILSQDGPAVAELLGGLPAHVTQNSPELSAAAAMMCCLTSDTPGIRSNVGRARLLSTTLNDRDAQILEALLRLMESVVASSEGEAVLQADVAADALARLALITESEMPALEVYRQSASLLLASGRFWNGRLEEAEALLRRLTEGWQEMPPALRLYRHSLLAAIAAITGRLRTADDELGEVFALQKQAGLLAGTTAMAHLAEALVHLSRAELAECADSLDAGSVAVEESPDRFTEAGHGLVRARLLLTTGKPEMARSMLAGLQHRHGGRSASKLVEGWLGGLEDEIRLASGEPLSDAVPPGLPRQRAAAGPPTPEDLVLDARVALEQNRPRRCLELLGPLIEDSSTNRFEDVEVWLQIALAYDRLRRDADALVAVGSAVRSAAPERIAQPFLMGGPRVRLLLERLEAADPVHRSFLMSLLRMLGSTKLTDSSAPLIDPLTNRERGILILLPTMMSNAEIADELCISVNTVKVHLKTLYRKLGVNSRRAAVIRARKLDLVEILGAPKTDQRG